MAQGVRVWGNRKLNPDVTIEAGVNDTLELEVDGSQVTVNLPVGTFVNHLELHTSEFTVALNVELSLQGVPVEALLGGIHDDDHRLVLVLGHKEVGGKTLVVTGGTGYDTVFGETYDIEPEIEEGDE